MARKCATLCLLFDQPTYPAVVADPAASRQALDRFFRAAPDLFPDEFAKGYRLKGRRRSRKPGLCLRRVRLKATGEAFTVRPAFALPYMAGLASGASGPLFLRAFGAPFWALARVFGRDHRYWYRPEVALGRNSVAGTTPRRSARGRPAVHPGRTYRRPGAEFVALGPKLSVHPEGRTMTAKYVPLSGSERHPVPGAHAVGPAPADELLEVTVRLRRRQPLSSPMATGAQAPGQRKYLTHAELEAKHGADPKDIAQVEAFAK